MTAGLGVLGLSAYAFLGLAARGLGPETYADLSVLWTLYNVVGPGLFSPVELEVGRSVADRRARGLGVGDLVRRALLLVLLLVAALVVLTLALAPFLLSPLLSGSVLLLAALLLSYPGAAAAHLSRGVLAGQQSFRRYGVQLAVDGGLRTLLAVLLFVVAARSGGAYGLVLGASALAAVALTLPRRAALQDPGPPCSWRELTAAVGWLVATSFLSQVLVNAGPVVVTLSGTAEDRVLAGPVLAGIVLTRLPLFLFTAVQAVLLPRLATLLARGQAQAFRRELLRLLAVVGALGAAGCLAAFSVGPALLRVGFGERFVLTPAVLLGLAAASAMYMVAVVLNHSLIALRAYGSATLAWTVGVVAFAVALAVAETVLDRVVWSSLAGCGAALVALGLALHVRLLRLERPVGASPVHGAAG